MEVVNDAVETATSLCGADVGNKIGGLIPEMINPWYDANICKLTKTDSSVDAAESHTVDVTLAIDGYHETLLHEFLNLALVGYTLERN